MASGFGLRGGPGRCYPFWMDFSDCYAKADDPKECKLVLDDYMECLHRKKEIARNQAIKEELEKNPAAARIDTAGG